jgi:hypothetical protein
VKKETTRSRKKIRQINFDLKPRKLVCHQIRQVSCVLKYSDINYSASSALKLVATGFVEMSAQLCQTTLRHDSGGSIHLSDWG